MPQLEKLPARWPEKGCFTDNALLSNNPSTAWMRKRAYALVRHNSLVITLKLLPDMPQNIRATGESIRHPQPPCEL